MVLYNTLVGFCAGIVIMTVADVVRRYPVITLPGHGVVLAVAGVPLTLLSAVATITWPLSANPPINIAFFEPSFMLGVLALAGAVVLLRRWEREVDQEFLSRLRPGLWLVFAIGLMLLAISSAIFSYNLVGDAPPNEPITGQFRGWENTTFGVVYLLAAIGCLVAPKLELANVRLVMRWSWLISGAFFLLFSILNFRTHIGLLINTLKGTSFMW